MKIINTKEKDDVKKLMDEIKEVFRLASLHFVFEKIWNSEVEVSEESEEFDIPKINWSDE